ncbi:MAG: chemotaxis protein CheA [Shewanella sp.]|nr:chemotaxis protein CheA [Shewanella sp.]
MAFDVDEEILQDFLVETGEILELLQEQLVSLENNPDDTELLNAIFRGFHTVKGGAGFLGLNPMVAVCHESENTFDLLRNGKRAVTPELMDIILQAVDTINTQYDQTQSCQDQEPASEELMANLTLLASGALLPAEGGGESVTPSQPAAAEVVVDDDGLFAPEPEPELSSASDAQGSSDEIDEDEFEAMLDALHGEGKGPGETAGASTEASSVSDSDDITDDEFEALLDELHSADKFESEVPDEPAKAEASREDITDDEFEKLLDELHGEGGCPSKTDTAPAEVAKAAPKAVVASPKSAPAAQTPAPKKPPVAAAKDKEPAAKAVPQGETTVRVDTARLDQIMNMVGELVLVRNRLISLGISRDDEEMSKALANLDLVTGDLQGAVMKTRMQPIKKVFGRFPRVVRDMARSLSKDIKLVTVGEETDLDKNLVEALADPLVHLVRNSVDHGIELPDVREKNGKPRSGTITLSACQEGDHILLKIEDDGDGMDPDKLKEIAISRGVLDEDSASRMSDAEAYNLIFAPGFSTKTEISDISGRGVGMDVVKTRITQLNGTVNIFSTKGKGTVLEIKVPLTLAIMPTLMVEVANRVFALPLSNVNEIFHLDLTKTNVVDGQRTVNVREKAVPLFYLESWLNQNSKFTHGDKAFGHVVIVQLAHVLVGFVVDSLIGQEEVVIKPLGKLLQGTPGMAGATITSDGGIALILDIPSLIKHYAKKNNDSLRT